MIITKVKQGRLRRLLNDARKNDGLFIADYPEQMLHTGHDDELATAIAKTENESINYLGVLVYGDTPSVTELTGKFMMWT